MRRYLFGILFLAYALSLLLVKETAAQNTAESIRALADRVMYLDESYVDSFLVYSKIIEEQSRKINYQRGICDSYRLRGIYHECRAEYGDAIEWHLKNLDLSEKIKDNESKLSALSDLSAQFHYLHQFEKAKFYVQQAILLSEKIPTTPKRISTFFLNLGIYYRETNQPDSALNSYKKSLEIKKRILDSAGIANVHINISTLLIDQKKYAPAQPYLTYNFAYHRRKNDEVNLWFDHLNQARIDVGQQHYSNAQQHLETALSLAKKIKSRQKEAETYEQWAYLYQVQNDYRNAFEMSRKYRHLQSEMINVETNKKVAELREKYDADKREQQNQVLEAEIETQKWQKQTAAIVAGAVTLLALLAGWAWWQNRKKNQLLSHKNDELEVQKNRLENTLQRLHQMREQLVLSEKMASIGQLTAGIAHEINNPISFVANNVQALKLDLTDITGLLSQEQLQLPAFIELNQEIQTLMESIERGVDRTRDIVQGLRIFARNEEGELTKVDLHQCIDTAVTLLRFEIRDRCQIIKRYGTIPPVSGLSGKLNQVFLNIITNAVQAVLQVHGEAEPPAGLIEIVTLKALNMVQVRITDNGCGMDEATRKRIFEPFFSTKPVGEGTGLGMSICYGIIEQHRGTIQVSSKPGVGTTIVIELPI
ncbi:MAG: ATP-binding protein [Spirosomataceae bacterium]